MSKDKHHVFAFGRMSPPTTGHGKLVDKVKEVAAHYGADHTVVLSHTHDSKKNPLTPQDKLKHAKRFFPKTNLTTSSKETPTYLAHAAKLHKSGVTHLHMVAGGDRTAAYERDLKHYNGKKKNSLYNFKKIHVHSAGERDPDAEGVEGMSASKMRHHAETGNYKEFKKGVPSHVSDAHAKEMFHDTRAGMGLHEEYRKPGEFYIPNNPGLPLARGVMPQIKTADVSSFSTYLKHQHGIDSAEVDVPMGMLRPTQAQFSRAKVRRLLSLSPYDAGMTDKKILISKDNYILDGHHHWLAKYNTDEFSSDRVIQYDAGIHDLLPAAREYPEARFRALDEETDPTRHLAEGLYDPGIFKCVFLAGGPGSGKDFVLGKIMGGFGFVEVSSDPFLGHLMKKAGLDLKMPEHETAPRDIARQRAKQLEQHKKELVINGRLGIILNGVADDYNEISQRKKDFEELGYDTMMVFVSVSDQESSRRNIMRGNLGGRTVPETIRAKKWVGAMENMNRYAQLFGRFFVEVDNSVDVEKSTPQATTQLEQGFQKAFKKIREFISVHPSKPNALEWINIQKSHRSSKAWLQKEDWDELFETEVLSEHAAGEQGKYNGVHGARVIRRLGVRQGRGKTPGAQWSLHHRASNTATPARKTLTKLRQETADAMPYDYDTAMGSTAPIGSNPPAARGYKAHGYPTTEDAKEPTKRKTLKAIIKESDEQYSINTKLANIDDLLK